MRSYGIKVTHLKYKLSSALQKKCRNLSKYDYAQVDQKVSIFMRNNIKGVNFFVVDKKGNYIYRNNAFSKLVGNSNNINIDRKSWEVSKSIMETGMQKTVEEEFQGTTYLSVKAPLVIDYKIEGVIGLAIDITDKKKKEELARKLKMREKLYEIAKEVAHDICSPLSALEIVKYMSSDKLSEKEREMFESSIRRIKDIADRLIERYRKINSRCEKEKGKEQEYIMPSTLRDLIESMRYTYQDRQM
jgi:hypothetical protein